MTFTWRQSQTLKQRPASVDALISSRAFVCQFQPQRSRLLIDREPERIFNTSKVPARHLFPLTGTSCRSENTLTATLENTKEMHLWKQLSILPPKQEFWLIFSVTHFLFCVPHERLWFKKKKKAICKWTIYNLFKPATLEHCCITKSGDFAPSDSLIFRIQCYSSSRFQCTECCRSVSVLLLVGEHSGLLSPPPTHTHSSFFTQPSINPRLHPQPSELRVSSC